MGPNTYKQMTQMNPTKTTKNKSCTTEQMCTYLSSKNQSKVIN